MTKVLVDKMPVDCVACPVYDGDRGLCNLLRDYPKFEWGERPTNCPLEEVKHGEWISKMVARDGEYAGWICSNCGYFTADSKACFYNYCPHCHAKMREDHDTD